jgi:hypothetical protein
MEVCSLRPINAEQISKMKFRRNQTYCSHALKPDVSTHRTHWAPQWAQWPKNTMRDVEGGIMARESPKEILRLLQSELAQRLLKSRIPARLAQNAKDGSPRVIPTWFHRDGSELVMATFIAGRRYVTNRSDPPGCAQARTSPSPLIPGRSRQRFFSCEARLPRPRWTIARGV